jgi:hypothetical protein
MKPAPPVIKTLGKWTSRSHAPPERRGLVMRCGYGPRTAQPPTAALAVGATGTAALAVGATGTVATESIARDPGAEPELGELRPQCLDALAAPRPDAHLVAQSVVAVALHEVGVVGLVPQHGAE